MEIPYSEAMAYVPSVWTIEYPRRVLFTLEGEEYYWVYWVEERIVQEV